MTYEEAAAYRIGDQIQHPNRQYWAYNKPPFTNRYGNIVIREIIHDPKTCQIKFVCSDTDKIEHKAYSHQTCRPPDFTDPNPSILNGNRVFHGTDEDKAYFLEHAAAYGLFPSDLGKVYVTNQGQLLQIIGIQPKARTKTIKVFNFLAEKAKTVTPGEAIYGIYDSEYLMD